MTNQRRRRGSAARSTRSAIKSPVQIVTHTGGTDDPVNGVARPLTVIPALREVRSTLIGVRAVQLTVHLALQGQNDDYDREFAETLRGGAINPLDHLIQRLGSILGIAPDAEI